MGEDGAVGNQLAQSCAGQVCYRRAVRGGEAVGKRFFCG
ncbi:hypothetical protein Slip_1632 [Syntrophothermus lipocalidus DSM 12680]|uniref:Uncharacterized protein n=1 Tax=Syntrophothermus lipocalidus (strain DSM 12680 / TGB-C1) TaxID=643648 RepID=D7CNV6_SYNLT|nr:hypothetical protein Slip_1632 [Syntrophothermus lipocalidus DSM 12680]